jgi:hypothetical protein
VGPPFVDDIVVSGSCFAAFFAAWLTQGRGVNNGGSTAVRSASVKGFAGDFRGFA